MNRKTTVINLRDKNLPDTTHIARVHRPYALGNPFKIERGTGQAERAEVIRQYSQDLFKNRAWLFNLLPALRGKKLACWCHPKDCHADLLAALADSWDYIAIPAEHFNPNIVTEDQKSMRAFWLPDNIALEVWTRGESFQWIFFIGDSWHQSTDLYTAVTIAIEQWGKSKDGS